MQCLKCVYKQIWGFASLSPARRQRIGNKSYQNKQKRVILPWEAQAIQVSWKTENAELFVVFRVHHCDLAFWHLIFMSNFRQRTKWKFAAFLFKSTLSESSDWSKSINYSINNKMDNVRTNITENADTFYIQKWTYWPNDIETMISVCVKLKASYHLIPDSIWQEITPPINVLNTILIPGRGSERTHYPTLARIAITIHLIASVSSLMLSGYSYRESYTAQGKQGHHTQIGPRCNLRTNHVRCVVITI